MVSQPRRVIMTYDDLIQMPDDRQRYEIIEGELEVTAAPSESHQTAVTNLAAILVPHVRRRRLGRLYVAPFDVYFSNVSTVEPDLLFVSAERLGIITHRYVQGAPDLVVEVLSPSTRGTDQVAKMQLYARYGVRNYWIFDPDTRQATAFALGPNGYDVAAAAKGEEVFAAPPFEDLEIPLAEVWE